jgi:SAM-dependent methyltransferase
VADPGREIALGSMPFYWRMVDRFVPSGAGPVPAFLPFSFSFDPTVGLLTQRPDPEVTAALERVYREDSNIGYLQEGHALAERYGGDFLRFVDRAIARIGGPVTSIVDVGCGGGYVLGRLRERGYRVAGIDPSPVAARFGVQRGIPIVSSFYPARHDLGRFDLVLSSGTLEHVPDPVGFLRAHRGDLAAGGAVVISVPSSGPMIELGDPSMLLHEHLSYFDADSLRRTVERAGYEVLALEPASYGLTLYCLAQPRHGAGAAAPAEGQGWPEFKRFRARLDRCVGRVSDYLRPRLESGRDVGFYVPLRALPYLAILGRLDRVRFFDDDPGVHGRYFDGFDVPVEDFADLQADPPAHVVVMSLPHARVIGARLAGLGLGDRMEVTSLEAIVLGG